jgi:ferredoxin
MGSGGMIVMDEHTCIVDVAKYFMAFLKDESCGTCFSCRKGTQRMHEILEDIAEGRATVEQLDLLEELAKVVKDTTLCGLGQTSANPVLSTLRYFRDEFLEHIEHKRCPAGVCKALITYSISGLCTGCKLCVKACPTGAIEGERKQRHAIDPEKCTRCGTCRSLCKQQAVEVA